MLSQEVAAIDTCRFLYPPSRKCIVLYVCYDGGVCLEQSMQGYVRMYIRTSVYFLLFWRCCFGIAAVASPPLLVQADYFVVS